MESFSRNINGYFQNYNSQQTVLNLWHIESFEGGSKSRSKYLEEIAVRFNKRNKTCYINIVSMKEDQLVLNLQQGKYADLYSFGVGSGCYISSNLLPLERNENILDSLQDFTEINNEVVCYPYMLGGYVAICRTSQINTNDDLMSLIKNNLTQETKKFKLTFSISQSINPSCVLLNNNVKNLNTKNFVESSSSYDAYINFLKNKNYILIGTTRDYYRCKNREGLGNLESCTYQYLGGYSDLIQYLGIDKRIDPFKINIAKSFANFVLQPESQKVIDSYGLFSVLKSGTISSNFMADFDLIFKSNNLSSISPFLPYGQINENKDNAFKNVFKI